MPLAPQTHNNVAAATGFGWFDLVIQPPSLEIRTKVFVQLGPNLGVFNKDEYLATWQERITELWDDKIRFRSQNGDLLTTKFRVQEVGAVENCHLPLRIELGYAGNSGIKLPKEGMFGGTRWYLELRTQDNLPYHQAAQANILSGALGGARAAMFLDEQTRVQRATPGGAQSFDVTLDRQRNNTWLVAPASQPTLNAVCVAIAGTPAHLPQPPIKVKASSGIADKATNLANTVIQYMRLRGVNAPATVFETHVTAKKFRLPGTAHKPTATVTVEVLPAGEMYKRLQPGQAIADYVVSAHEFGHMLGIPDEYLSYDTYQNATIRNSQPLWDLLCDAHVPPVAHRDWRNAFNESMMSVGTTIYKAHAVTIWDALEKKTGLTWTITQPV